MKVVEVIKGFNDFFMIKKRPAIAGRLDAAEYIACLIIRRFVMIR